MARRWAAAARSYDCQIGSRVKSVTANIISRSETMENHSRTEIYVSTPVRLLLWMPAPESVASYGRTDRYGCSARKRLRGLSRLRTPFCVRHARDESRERNSILI